MPLPHARPVEHPVPLSGRRGALVAGALVCAVLLVVGYGSGVGIVPSDLDLADGEPGPTGDGGRDRLRGPVEPVVQAVVTGPTTTDRTGGTTRTVVGGDGTTSSTTRPPTIGMSPSTTWPASPPGTTAPSPGTAPPPTDPPADCATLVDALLQGLDGYLAGADPDAAVVQRVSDVLGLGQLLPQDEGLLGSVVTPLRDATVAALGSTLQPNTGAVSDLTPDPDLVPELRTLLGVDVTGVSSVTEDDLTGLLDAVLRGC
jgi:hypothetical protein